MKLFKLLFLLFTAIMLFTACASKNITLPPLVKTSAEIVAELINQSRIEKYSDTLAVDVYYATNRESNDSKSDCSNESFNNKASNLTSFGYCRVNVPKKHDTGKIQPALDSRSDSHKYFRVLSQKKMDTLTLQSALIKNPTKDILVFVHGFNVKFQDAVFRASQIAYDLKFQGLVILFSWPAGADSGFINNAMISRTYENNKANALQSIGAAKDFFKLLSNINYNINLIVHSMGHQVVLPALSQISKEQNPTLKIKELVLNAPDFDAKEFINLAPDLVKISKRITVYCSYNDNAISASENVNNGERLGACEKVDGVDVINVSEVDSPAFGLGLGHSYYSSRAVLSDVAQLMLGIETEKRLFIRKSEPNSTEDYYLRP